MPRVDTFRVACGICGWSIDNGGHMVEECPDETREAAERRHAAESAKRPTLIPSRAERLVFATRCHGGSIEPVMEHREGSGVVLTGRCSECLAPVCRQNPRTKRGEWLNGADVFALEDAEEVARGE